MKTGIELIIKERKEQIEKHGRTVDLDVLQNARFQLVQAAVQLICFSEPLMFKAAAPFGWDKNVYTKMSLKSYKERLIIAGALIAAEIDRISAL